MAKTSTSFKPGESGNKKGRPKKEWTWAGLLKDLGDKRDKDYKMQQKKKVAEVLYRKAMRGDIQAAKIIMDRTDGAPLQPVESDTQINLNIHDFGKDY